MVQGAPKPATHDQRGELVRIASALWWHDSQYHVPLEDFRPPTTPEHRMHRVLVVLFIIGGIRAVFGVFVGSRYSVETAIGVFVVAIAYAVWRYLRQPHDRSARRMSN